MKPRSLFRLFLALGLTTAVIWLVSCAPVGEIPEVPPGPPMQSNLDVLDERGFAPQFFGWDMHRMLERVVDGIPTRMYLLSAPDGSGREAAVLHVLLGADRSLGPVVGFHVRDRDGKLIEQWTHPEWPDKWAGKGKR